MLDPVRVDAHRDVLGLVADLVPVADLDDQGVEVDPEVELFQRPRLPGLDLLGDRVGDPGDRVVRQLGPDRAGRVVLDVADRHPALCPGIPRAANPGPADPGYLRGLRSSRGRGGAAIHAAPSRGDSRSGGLRSPAEITCDAAYLSISLPDELFSVLAGVLGCGGGQPDREMAAAFLR